jgi:hypothetical protein
LVAARLGDSRLVGSIDPKRSISNGWIVRILKELAQAFDGKPQLLIGDVWRRP